MYVKFDGVIQLIVNSVRLMDLSENLTLKLKMSKVKDKGQMDSDHQGVYASEVWKNYHQ